MFNNFYFWNYPEWFDTTAYNSLPEICLAYVEQIICIKYWIYETSLLKEKPEKILSLNFLNDTKFNDIFEKRDKIKLFLEDQFQNQKEKLFSEKISLTNILKDLKNDQNIISKIKPRKNETKSCFYSGPHSSKDIMQSGSIYKTEMYQENEMIDNIKKSYLNSKEINFIDEIMFSDVNRLNTLKDFLYKGIFDNVYNLYTEKNANDLLNENYFDNDYNNTNINEKIKKKQKVKYTKKKKTENNIKKTLNDNKKIDSIEEEDKNEKEKSQKKLLEQIKNYNKFSNKKSKSFNDLKQLFFSKDIKYFVANNEMIRYDPDLDSENDLFNQEILIKNTVSKVLNNIYISLGETDNNKINHDDLSLSRIKDKKDSKTKSKANSKLKKNNKKTEKKMNKETIESEKTDTDTEHSNNVNDKYLYCENKSKNLIEVKENERIRRNKTCERKLYGLNKTTKFIKTDEIKSQEKITEDTQINITKNDSSPLVKTREKSKKKKHRQKYKTNNNTNNKNSTKIKKEIEQPNELKKCPSIVHSTHSLPEKKGSFDKKEVNEYKKMSTNVVSKNFNLSIIADKEKSIYNDPSKSYLYSNNYNEDLRKNKGYNSGYNKFNNFGSSGTTHQYFNNRNLNYNRYIEESSMVINNYNINFNLNIMNNFNILQKIEGFYPNFYFQLHNELLDYSNSINEINLMLKDIKLYSISYVENIIKQVLNCQIIIDIYGSFATDLCIESSDIDLTVRIMDPNINISEEIFTKLSQDIEKLKVFDSVNPILTASVPILKLIIDPKKIIDKSNKILEDYETFLSSNLYTNYYFKKEELLKIKIDLNVTNAHTKTFSTYSSVEWAKKQISVYPEIKILLQYLKRFLQIHKLNSSFNGGLSSYSLLLILVAYVKFSKTIYIFDLGHLLAEFFEFFGKYFDFKFGVIDVNQPNPILRYNNILDIYPCILDPITYLNVSKNSFRIQEITDLFAKCFDIISQIKIKFDKNDYKETSILYSILNMSELK